MPCHVPATSTSSRRRALYLKRPPTIAAKLDLNKPGEAWAADYLRRACSGRSPMWRLLAFRRDAAELRVAVRWHQCDGQGPFSVVTLSLVEMALRWRYFDTASAARAALDDKQNQAPGPPSGTSRSRRG